MPNEFMFTMNALWHDLYIKINLKRGTGDLRSIKIYLHSEKKLVPAIRNVRINSASTVYYKAVTRAMNKLYKL